MVAHDTLPGLQVKLSLVMLGLMLYCQTVQHYLENMAFLAAA